MTAPSFPAFEPALGVDGIGGQPAPRKRLKPGERRVQILRTLASMLETPDAERVTTAALAARLEVSEAALYRHFASKAQMFEGLIEFVEARVFTLIDEADQRETGAPARLREIVALVLQFGEKNPGMARLMVGDALVFENQRLLARMNRFFERVEARLLRNLATASDNDRTAQASVLTAFLIGRLQRFARSGFTRPPTEHLDAALRLLIP